jgi:predicted nucleic acid-binding Zn ribbon protein
MKMFERCIICGKANPSDRYMVGISTCGIICDKKRHTRNQDKRNAKVREDYRKMKEGKVRFNDSVTRTL